MKRIIQAVFTFAVILLISCSQQTTQDIKSTTPTAETEQSTLDWKDIQLNNVITGKTFKISDFKGKPVLLESFAVWCPTCTQQQKEIKRFHEEVGDFVISISLDTDPNEDIEQVKEHINRNGFNWLYTISPVEFTRQLIDEFGVGIVNAPTVPVILICKDQSTRMLGRGIKSVSKLNSEIAAGC